MKPLLDLPNPLCFLMADPDQDKDNYIKSALTNRERSSHLVLQQTYNGQPILKRGTSSKMKKLPKAKERLTIKEVNWLKKSSTPKLLISNLGLKTTKLKGEKCQLPEDIKNNQRNKPLLVNRGNSTRFIPKNSSVVGIETLKVQYKKSSTSQHNVKSLTTSDLTSNTLSKYVFLTEKKLKQPSVNAQLLQLVERLKQTVTTFQNREKQLLGAYNSLKEECAILKTKLASVQT